MTNKTSTLIQSMRDDLRDRRSARAEYRSLKAALATYNSPSEVDDLLLVAEADNADSALLRSILSDNLQRHHVAHAGSVSGMRLSA